MRNSVFKNPYNIYFFLLVRYIQVCHELMRMMHQKTTHTHSLTAINRKIERGRDEEEVYLWNYVNQ
jgi:hypothetical protein